MSRAFDTIDRTKLMSILERIPGMTDDHRRLIRLLLANTSLQGDGLSPILFAIYLEAAICELIARGPKYSQYDLHLPHSAIYADDTDFISLSLLPVFLIS